MILVLSQETTKYGTSFELQAEKKSAFISVSDYSLQVICNNASHSVWRGAGKVFSGKDVWQKAMDAYKSAEMKAMIQYAKEEMA